MNHKLSPSDLTYLFDGCKFCFWLKVRYGIAQPSMPMPGIFSAIAGRQKEFYSNKRTGEFCPDLPPGIVVYGEQPVQSKPIYFDEISDQCYIRGRFDCVIKFDDGSYGVIDFKTASPSEEKAEMYGRQLQAYAYALENPESGKLSLTPIKKLGLLFFEPQGFGQLSLNEQMFKGRLIWIEVERNNSGFIDFLKEVMSVLSRPEPPDSASDCVWCSYRNQMQNFDFKTVPNAPVAAGSPLCPICNGSMGRRQGKYGDFWSCQRFPDCRGTRKI